MSKADTARKGSGSLVSCEICGTPTAMTGTKRCDRCWELEKRILREPDLARRILDGTPRYKADDPLRIALEIQRQHADDGAVYMPKAMWKIVTSALRCSAQSEIEKHKPDQASEGAGGKTSRKD